MAENIGSYDYGKLITDLNKNTIEFYREEFLGNRPEEFEIFRSDLVKVLQNHSNGTDHELYNTVKEALNNKDGFEKYPFLNVYHNEKIQENVKENYPEHYKDIDYERDR